MSAPTTAEAQALLDRAADAGVHRLSVPTPFTVGRVNCWLIDDDPLTLVDTGPNSGDALDTLEQALAQHGRRIGDLERIVISHQHADHTGLADILARRSGAEVCAITPLAAYLASHNEQTEADDIFAEDQMRRHGVPADVVAVLRAVSAMARGWGGRATVTRPLHDGEVLTFAGRSLRAWHRPGHSPSDTIFHDEQRGLLLAADHLLPHISSNPLLSRSLDGRDHGRRPEALVTYLASLRSTRAMDDVDVLLPGHGDPFAKPAALIDQRLRMHERRAEKIAGLIAEHPRTAYELGVALWGRVALTQAYLALSEVLGHVDLLLRDGRVVEEPDDEGIVLLMEAP